MIESENAKEEIREIVGGCIKCGLCRSLCPVLRELKEEQYSPRGKAMMLSDESIEKIIYDCTLCKACEKQCPANLKLCKAFIHARAVLVKQKKEIPENREMIKNLEKSGNMFGTLEEEN
ncbi:Lactate utilization protein B [uncultured archaeon]|nr:Lactate utilization protein B [uncultured archaeon]